MKSVFNRAGKSLCNLQTLKLPFPPLNRQIKGPFGIIKREMGPNVSCSENLGPST
jgi:hypothetical protein